jgi:hypothetical protein
LRWEPHTMCFPLKSPRRTNGVGNCEISRTRSASAIGSVSGRYMLPMVKDNAPKLMRTATACRVVWRRTQTEQTQSRTRMAVPPLALSPPKWSWR